MSTPAKRGTDTIARKGAAAGAAKPAGLRLARGDESAGAVPRTGVVLVGTRLTVNALREQMRHLDPEPVVAGCVLVEGGDGGETGSESDCPFLGWVSDLQAIHARLGIRMAVVSLPREMGEEVGRVRGVLRGMSIPDRFVPTLADQLELAGVETLVPVPLTAVGQTVATSEASRTYRPPPPLDLAALVGRKPYVLDRAAVSRVLTGKRVLITGAGGSIGSELARVAAGFKPEMLILMERSENALFEIDRQLGERFPAVARRAVLHDVVDEGATARLLRELTPHAVFHAAAHKHVPLMEDHPGHAVTNNLFGTKAIADAAVAAGAERFVMISSDKAVNPRSVMGATKRLAEVYVRSLAKPGCRTRLSMVRFGNVLGSACSVLTIWSQQLAEGGPLTVTDPRMTRFFMTIPEAATLVIQSAAIDGGAGAAPVYVLDMGEPVRILDLAVRFAKAHGLEPRVRPETAADPSAVTGVPVVGAGRGEPVIDIGFTGTRPGEKLHEELSYAAELLMPTGFAGINSWAGAAPERGTGSAGAMIADLGAVRQSPDRAAVLAAIRRHVPEMG